MLHRRPLVSSLLERRPDHLLAVAGLGSAAWDLAASGDDPRDFHFIGAMGQAAPFGFGLAMARPDKRVVLFTGDGELLMGLGALATIANHAPQNLAVVVLDNESYEETGGQASATAGRTDLEAVARACGIKTTRTVTRSGEIAALRDLVFRASGPVFAVAKVVAEALPLVFPPSFDGVSAINRFHAAAVAERGGG
jgi:thiamine pyrophosphate-dependent acetolactate synthase large subunit-like protein